MFQFPGYPPPGYVFARRWQDMTPARFPDSDTPGSKLACSSPRHFAAGRVLHRLSLPRHPPRALSSLTPSRQQIWLGPRERDNITRLSRLCCYQGSLAGDRSADGDEPRLRLAPTQSRQQYSVSVVEDSRFTPSDNRPDSGRRPLYHSVTSCQPFRLMLFSLPVVAGRGITGRSPCGRVRGLTRPCSRQARPGGAARPMRGLG